MKTSESIPGAHHRDRVADSRDRHMGLSGHRTYLCVALAALVLQSACVGGESESDSQGTLPPVTSLSCGERAERSSDPWIPGPGGYRRAASRGGEGEWFGQVSGAAVAGNNLYVFDASRARIVSLDAVRLTVEDSSGGEGSGPGEFNVAPSQFSVGQRYRRWVVADGSRLIVFDGDRFQVFGLDGKYRSPAMRSPTHELATPETSRFGWSSDSLFAFSGGYDAFTSRKGDMKSGPSFVGWLRVGSRATRLLSFRVPPLPVNRRGVLIAGRRQARPVWALGPRCLWANDGSRPVFYRALRSGGGRDSLVLSLHLPDPPRADSGQIDFNRNLRRMGAGSAPEPTALRRIRDLLFDPAGRLWIQLADGKGAHGETSVVILDPRSDSVTRTTVPAFPLMFGSPGTYYAVTRDELDRSHIARFVPGDPS